MAVIKSAPLKAAKKASNSSNADQASYGVGFASPNDRVNNNQLIKGYFDSLPTNTNSSYDDSKLDPYTRNLMFGSDLYDRNNAETNARKDIASEAAQKTHQDYNDDWSNTREDNLADALLYDQLLNTSVTNPDIKNTQDQIYLRALDNALFAADNKVNTYIPNTKDSDTIEINKNHASTAASTLPVLDYITRSNLRLGNKLTEDPLSSRKQYRT